MENQKWIFGLLLSIAMLPSFAEQPMAGMAMHEKPAQATHQGVGKVISVNKAGLKVKLAHEAIQSLGWPGMTMDCKVSNAALLDGIKAGDAVTFELGKDNGAGKWQVTRITPKEAKSTGTR